jgi:hypothetical protein
MGYPDGVGVVFCADGGAAAEGVVLVEDDFLASFEFFGF